MSTALDHILSLAWRDLSKFFRDKGRIAATFIFPAVFLGVFGMTLDSGIGRQALGFSYLEYVFSGILMQTMFQSSFMGIVSLISDREKDFSMSIFVAPVSRLAIVTGKIFGESLVSTMQFLSILLLGVVIGVPIQWWQLPLALLFAWVGSFVGASVGLLAAGRIDSADTANRIFPFIVFPMMFLSGAFTPVNNLPWFLTALKIINPMHYGVDLMRHVLFSGRPEVLLVTSRPAWQDAAVFIGLGVVSLVVGSWLFSQKEGNR